jgi:hypothetical protein
MTMNIFSLFDRSHEAIACNWLFTHALSRTSLDIALFKNVFRKLIVQTPVRGHTKNATLLKILTIEFTVRVYLYAYMHLHAGISVRL